jgi:hypothetical protein
MTPQTFQSVLLAIYNTVVNSGVFGTSVGSVDFAMARDSDIKWPTGPPPFALIIPGACNRWTTQDGGGRNAKTWQWEIEIGIVVQEIIDKAYKDTQAFLTTSSTLGVWVLAQSLIDMLEQAYPLDSNGGLALIELPVAERAGEPYRFRNANNLIALPVAFSFKWWQSLPASLP